jgi:hypothetical protein
VDWMCQGCCATAHCTVVGVNMPSTRCAGGSCGAGLQVQALVTVRSGGPSANCTMRAVHSCMHVLTDDSRSEGQNESWRQPRRFRSMSVGLGHGRMQVFVVKNAVIHAQIVLVATLATCMFPRPWPLKGGPRGRAELLSVVPCAVSCAIPGWLPGLSIGFCLRLARTLCVDVGGVCGAVDCGACQILDCMYLLNQCPESEIPLNTLQHSRWFPESC